MKNSIFSPALGNKLSRLSQDNLLAFVRDHLPKLQRSATQDSRLANLHTDTLGVFERYQRASLELRLAESDARGSNSAFNHKMDLMLRENGTANLLHHWNMQIQLVFDRQSDDYQDRLFPKGRTPFRSGNIDARIQQVGVLVHSLSRYPELKELQLEMDGFYQELVQLRNRQQVHEQAKELALARYHQEKDALVERLVHNRNALLGFFPDNLPMVVSLFEPDLLRYKRRTRPTSHAADTPPPAPPEDSEEGQDSKEAPPSDESLPNM